MDQIVKEAAERFKDAVEAESDNRKWMLDDLQFVYMADEYQWPQSVRAERERQKRPCLVINRMPQFIRQVVNDARQNRPSIKVSAVDSKGDPATADVLSGIIRHIERNSDADIAYDTAVESAVSSGIGYFTIGTEYANDDSFEQDLSIDRVVSPFSIYGDPDSEAGDSSDWKCAFQIVTMSVEAAQKKYKSKELKAWEDGATGDTADDEGKDIRLARYWKVAYDEKTLVQLTNGAAVYEDELNDDLLALMAAQGVGVQEGRSRKIERPRVTLHILSGDVELEEPADWAGRYIPIIPVYGSEFWIDGKRYWKSLIRDAKDPQRMLNYWRTASTELVALAPKAPFIGPKGFAKSSPRKWATANTENHAYLEYDETPSGNIPQRQPFAGMPAGALQEALNAQDDIKSVTGLYDASLGARSNETSGRAIMARQREGDVSTFHFSDNLVRAIRHAGRILLDLIPKVYDTPRVVRILGIDGTPQQVQINQPTVEQDEDGNAIERIYDMGVGRYDVDVRAGPSYTTQRQEAAAQMTELIRAFPAAAPVIGDLLAKSLDWPEADEVAKRLEKMVPGNEQNPEQMAQMAEQIQQGQQAIEQGKQEIEIGKRELEKMVADLKVQQANLKAQEANLKAQIATAQADLQNREAQLQVRGMETAQRGAQMEAQARQSGEQSGVAVVQQALEAVQAALTPISQQIGALEQKLGQQSQQPIIVPIQQGGSRRRVKVSRGPAGELMGDIEDVNEDD